MMFPMRGAIRHIICDPDPQSLPDSPMDFFFNVRLMVGPVDGPGEESFDLSVCSPEWLGRRSHSEGIICGLHHLIINLDDFDERVLRQWLEGRVAAIEEPTWAEYATKLGLVGLWEFDGYAEPVDPH
jgi:hypothetical protein